MSTYSDRRLPRLDALRGVAIIAVMTAHAYTETMGHRADRFPVAGLWSGVDLFFVLSGLFIGGQLLREMRQTGSLALGRFWLRRGLRIWPSYLVAYGLFTLVDVQSALRHHTWTVYASRAIRRVPYNVLFVQNYTKYGIAWPSSWSLAVEEHFYILLPLFLLALARLPKPLSVERPDHRLFRVTAVAAGVLILEIVIRSAEIAFLDNPNLYYRTHVRLDGLAVGVWLAWVTVNRPGVADRASRFSPMYVALAVVAAWFFASLKPAFAPLTMVDELRYTLLALAFGAWVASASARDRAAVPVGALTAGLAWVGRYSYCLYLSQAVVRDVPYYDPVEQRLAGLLGPVAAPLMFAAASLCGALALSHSVERPMLRLRDRLFRTRTEEAPSPVLAPVPAIS